MKGIIRSSDEKIDENVLRSRDMRQVTTTAWQCSLGENDRSYNGILLSMQSKQNPGRSIPQGRTAECPVKDQTGHNIEGDIMKEEGLSGLMGGSDVWRREKESQRERSQEMKGRTDARRQRTNDRAQGTNERTEWDEQQPTQLRWQSRRGSEVGV